MNTLNQWSKSGAVSIRARVGVDSFKDLCLKPGKKATVIIELLLAIGCIFLDGGRQPIERPFSLEDYLSKRETLNAEHAYRDEMRRLNWRE